MMARRVVLCDPGLSTGHTARWRARHAAPPPDGPPDDDPMFDGAGRLRLRDALVATILRVQRREALLEKWHKHYGHRRPHTLRWWEA